MALPISLTLSLRCAAPFHLLATAHHTIQSFSMLLVYVYAPHDVNVCEDAADPIIAQAERVFAQNQFTHVDAFLVASSYMI